MDSKGEIMLTIMASLAQQESQSLSQNVKLGIQYRYQQGEVQVNHKRFLAQFDTIKKLAEEESCVIIGRCADYALEYNPNCVKAFIRADIDTRIKRAINEYGVNPETVEEKIKKIDKQRENYYNFYTGKKWGNMENYDITLNSAFTGIDGAIKVIEDLVRNKYDI